MRPPHYPGDIHDLNTSHALAALPRKAITAKAENQPIISAPSPFVIHQAWKSGVKRLLFLGSSCIYPRDCPQPIKEEYLLTGPLEETNMAYAIAKIAGIEMCAAYNRQYGTRFLCAMPTNLYGPGDNCDLETSHVLPALIRKFHEAKERRESEVVVWGTGTPRREFLHSGDLADACLFLIRLSDNEFTALVAGSPELPLINIGAGKDLTIAELAMLINEIVGFKGELTWDHRKPDGTPQKLLMVSRMQALGWLPKITLKEGIADAYRHYQDGRTGRGNYDSRLGNH